MKFISCFSGIEAASVASHHLGWDAIAFSEIDKFASAVLAHRFPGVPNLGDITKVNWSDYAGTVGLVCGGSPCQAFSVAGLRKSLEDPRGNLTIEYMRAVHEIKPKWFVWENVTGTFSASGNPFGSFVAGLAGYDSAIEPPNGRWGNSGFLIAKDEESYSLAWRVLDAQFFGVPQRRRRIFLVGHLGIGCWWKPLEVLFERHRENGHPSQGRKAREEVAEDAGRSVEVIGFPAVSNALLAKSNLSHRMDTDNVVVMAHGQGGAEIREGQARCLTCNHEAPIFFAPRSPDGHARVMDGVCETLNTAQGGQRTPCVAFNWQSGGDCRLEPRNEQANTLQRCQTQAVLSNTIVRRLTPEECEKLQGFPVGWTKIPYRGKLAHQCPDGPRYKALGNSWAVCCAKWIFDRIEKLKAAGVAPRMLINESTGQIEEVYNERDIPKSQATIDAEASADAAIQAERERQRREERIQSAMDEILLESVLKHGSKISEATFLRLVADAAVSNSGMYNDRDNAEKIVELLPEDGSEDGSCKSARESAGIDAFKLRGAVLYWAIQSIGIEDIEPAIWKEFGISLKKARAEAEKRVEN